MASNKLVVLGPIAVPVTTNTSASDLFSPPTGVTGGTNVPSTVAGAYYIIRHIRVINQTASSAKIVVWKAATTIDTAAKNVVWGGAASAGAVTQGTSVAANSFLEWFGAMRLDSAETDKILRAASDTASALSIQCEAEVGF